MLQAYGMMSSDNVLPLKTVKEDDGSSTSLQLDLLIELFIYIHPGELSLLHLWGRI